MTATSKGCVPQLLVGCQSSRNLQRDKEDVFLRVAVHESGHAVEFSFTEQQDVTEMRVKRLNPLQQVRDSRRGIFFPERHRRKGKEADRCGIFFSQFFAELLDPGGQQLIMDCRMSGIYVFERS